jgi:membrane protein
MNRRIAAIVRLITIRIKALLRYCAAGVWSDTRHRWYVDTIKTLNLTVRSFLDSNLQIRASALTYNTLLAIVPALALIFAIGRGFGFENIVQTQLFQALPSQKSAIEAGINFVGGYLAQASQGVFVGVGIVVLLWTMISLMGNIESSFNAIWGVTQARSFGRKVIDYTAIMFLLPIMMICSSGLSVVANYLINGNAMLQFISPALKIVIDIVPIVLTWLSFTGMFLAFPNTKVRFKNAFFCGVFSGTAFQVLQYLFLSGQIYVSKYNAIYGSFAFLPLLLIWLQLTWTIILAGAVLCYSSQNIFQFNFSNDISTISLDYKRKIAIVIMALIVKRFDRERTPLTVMDFAATYRMPSRLVSGLLNEMHDAKLVSQVIIDDEEVAYQPAIDPSKLTIGLMMTRLNAHGTGDFIPEFNDRFAGLVAQIDANVMKAADAYDTTLLRDIPIE